MKYSTITSSLILSVLFVSIENVESFAIGLAASGGMMAYNKLSPEAIAARDLGIICSRPQTEEECLSGTGLCMWDRAVGCRFDSDSELMKKKCEKPENNNKEKCEEVSSHCIFNEEKKKCEKSDFQKFTGRTPKHVEEICNKVAKEHNDACKRTYQNDCVWDMTTNLAKCFNLA